MLWLKTEHCPPEADLADVLGFIPTFLSEEDPRPAAEQIGERYISGWRPVKGFTLNPDTGGITYPGDPEMLPWAGTVLHEAEVLLVYYYGYTGIFQEDGSFSVARLD